jgi:chromosome segregation ATPase
VTCEKCREKIEEELQKKRNKKAEIRLEIDQKNSALNKLKLDLFENNEKLKQLESKLEDLKSIAQNIHSNLESYDKEIENKNSKIGSIQNQVHGYEDAKEKKIQEISLNRAKFESEKVLLDGINSEIITLKLELDNEINNVPKMLTKSNN